MSKESVECPLCMEPMDFDDIDFYPCPCRYQICRFCWDKIINEENGLCPACRKSYNSEHPASYKPRTEEEIKNKIKHSKKMCPKKTKSTTEGKDYLAEYRVLQKNLIFVVGLPMRMADEVELLKGVEYFGKCGKVYKIVINQNQTFPGPQGTPCLSAYITYHKNEDALKTLVDLKKLEIDGRAVKLSLGTTKYCSQYLRNRRCTKSDCMYLHDMGDQAASFTKDDMANGKHTEYENQLIQEYHDTQTNKPTNITHVSNSGPLPITLPSPNESDKSIPGISSIPTMILSRSEYNSNIAPIGTMPNDVQKIHSVNASEPRPVNRRQVNNSESNPSPQESEPYLYDLHISGTTLPPHPPPVSDSPYMYSDMIPDSGTNSANNSLLDSFYYLNSQTLPYDQSIDLQTNNSGQFSFKSEMDFSRSFECDKNDNVYETCKDTADIDFDPINISRIGLAELIANESRQKSNLSTMNNYSTQNQSMLRGSSHKYVVQSSSNDFFNEKVSNRSFLQTNDETRINFNLMENCMDNIIENNVAINTTSSNTPRYPSPPPGFETSHNNGCIGKQDNDAMMSMLINRNNADMYNQYQSPHQTADMSLFMGHRNQYTISRGNNFHNDFNNFQSNCDGDSSGGRFHDDITSQSPHAWAHTQPTRYESKLSQDLPQHNIGSRSTVYNRSHSMNENTELRSLDWNGFSSYNNNINHNLNDPHSSNFSDSNLVLSALRGQQNMQYPPTNVGKDSYAYVNHINHFVNQ